MSATSCSAPPMAPIRCSRRAFQRAPEARFEVVGIYRVTDPDAEAWYGDRALQVVNIGGSLDSPIAFATALVAPDTLDGLVTGQLPIRYPVALPGGSGPP